MPLLTPTLRTTRLLLRPFAETDADAIYALQSNARVLRYWDSPPWTDRTRAQDFLAACQRMEQEGSGLRFAIERLEAGNFIGWCSMFRWNPVCRSLDIGYCLDETAWSKGFATEAVQALLQWAYGTFDLNRVEAELDTRNIASARVLEKLGFKREGLRREDCVVNGEVSDSWIYGLLKRDWNEVASAVHVVGAAYPSIERTLGHTGEPVFHIRPATAADETASFAVTEAAMRPYVEATWGRWNPEEQIENHRRSFNPATHQVVLVGGAVAGIVAVAEQESHVQLEKLYLLPAYRNQGLGAQLLTSVIKQARETGRPVKLRVLRVNTSAQRFYAKHGFSIESETPERVFMARVASQEAPSK